jgi:hypothetical protein
MDLYPVIIATITAALLLGVGINYGAFNSSHLEGSAHLHKINTPDVTSPTLGPVRMDNASMHFGLLGPGPPVLNKTIPKHIWYERTFLGIKSGMIEILGLTILYFT